MCMALIPSQFLDAIVSHMNFVKVQIPCYVKKILFKYIIIKNASIKKTTYQALPPICSPGQLRRRSMAKWRLGWYCSAPGTATNTSPKQLPLVIISHGAYDFFFYHAFYMLMTSNCDVDLK